jgi:hypothetical protein
LTFRVKFQSQNCVSLEEFQFNVDYAKSKGLPFVTVQPAHSRRLAVVGGGPSIRDHLEELRTFDDVWGINQTASWLISQGIEATVFSVDPMDCLADMIDGVTKGLLAANCAPRAIDKLSDVMLFHTEEGGDLRALVGPSSATRATTVSLWLGFRDVTFFGCEGSYGPASHAYRDERRPHQLIIKAGGKDYITQPDYMVQCESLASICKAFPHVFREKCGGLLTAMIEHQDTWEVVALSEALKNKIDPTATVRYAA